MGNTNKIYSIFGQKGSGKSYLSSKIIDRYYNHNYKPYIVVIDNDASYINDKNLDFLKKVVINRHTAKQSINWKSLILENRHVLFVFQDLLKEERKQVLNEILNSIYQIENTLLVTDESHLFFPKNSPAQEYERIVTGGRHANVDMIFITQRFQLMNLLAVSQADVLIVFKENEYNTLKRICFYLPNVEENQIMELEERQFFMKYRNKVFKMSTDNL